MNKSIKKKKWGKPILVKLDFKKTYGGNTYDTGEDAGYIS